MFRVIWFQVFENKFGRFKNNPTIYYSLYISFLIIYNEIK